MRNPSADDLIAFLNASPTPWHAVAEAARRLDAAGALRLREDDPWSPDALRPGTLAYVIRGGGSLAAFRVPGIPDEASAAPRAARPMPFRIVAAHTDSPGLRLKPRPRPNAHGYRQWGVEAYGGILNNSWLDRDLALAGRAFRATGDGAASEPALVRFDAHPVRIPQLAIHLDRGVNDGLTLNPERHLVPILGLDASPESSLEALLEQATGAPFPDLAFDLCLVDAQPAAYGGLDDAFIHSGRLDNLAMCHAALAALLGAHEAIGKREEKGKEKGAATAVVPVAVLFDHEEVGSVSGHGAASNFLAAVLERLAFARGLDREAWLRALPQSFLISADMAHALHPNYPERHDGLHFPLPNRGPVLKANANLRYATDAGSAARFRGWAARAGVPVQDFVNRADLACGSTVGPGLSAALGIPAVDAGNAMLSMHSARELCGADDPALMTAVMREFFQSE